MIRTTKTMRIVLIAAFAALMAAPCFAQMPVEPNIDEIGYSEFLADMAGHRVHDATIRGHVVTGHLADGQSYTTYAPNDPALVQRLIASQVTVRVAPAGAAAAVMAAIRDWLPLLVMAVVSIAMMQEARSLGRPRISIGQTRVHRAAAQTRPLTFADVAGVDEACGELREIVDYLKQPLKFAALGGEIPKGCLLTGPPGTGKTLLARAVAGEANVPFLPVAGSEFVEIYAGLGAARIREMFTEAREKAPCIVFIDEIDALGRSRSAGGNAGSEEREQTLNQLLVELDGFSGRQGVIVIAATNRPDVLDPALLRPGRFDRQVVVPAPDVRGRAEILAVHLRRVPAATDVDVDILARGTPGLSGAELANLVNEAALRAARLGEATVTMADLEAARERVLLGPERRSLAVSDADRRQTACHEAGHALVSLLVAGNDPVLKVTIVPRGQAAGATLALPDHDRRGLSRREAEARIAMLLAGRVAETLVYGPDGVTTGAGDDIRRATRLARRMVTEFGFSCALGPLHYAADEAEAMLGEAVTVRGGMSEATAETIDVEVAGIVRRAEAVARDVLTRHMDVLHRLVRLLLAQETVSGEEIQALLASAPGSRDGLSEPLAGLVA